MQLTDHFSLEELTFSEKAARLGLDNSPDKPEVDNLVLLCRFILEPLRSAFGRPVVVTSGFRAPVVNKAVGGASTSHHLSGRAADIRVTGVRPIEVCRMVAKLALPYEQCILEFGSWCHVSIPLFNSPPKRELLTAKKDGKKTVYLIGLVEV